MDEDFLHQKLNDRRAQFAYRQLRLPDGKTDLCSNDYLGIVRNGLIEQRLASTDTAADSAAPDPTLPAFSFPAHHGSGGSRLLAGNYSLIEETEDQLAAFHEAEAGIIFNSGYDANLGLLSCVPQRGDTILYDSLSHASIRDGIRLSFAQSFSFLHNDLGDLAKKLQAAASGASTSRVSAGSSSHASQAAAASTASGIFPAAASAGSSAPASGTKIFVVTESVFSMDGDQAPLREIVELCRLSGAYLIVDEAHATGVIGPKGEGLVQEQGLQKDCFARIHTFGKAVGCHGAIILGSETLRHYLINFSRAFIYTTALPETSILAIRKAYELFPQMQTERAHLQTLIRRFQRASLSFDRLRSATPIQGVVVPGNGPVRALAARLQAAGLDIRPILYPTVPKGGERLRIVLHAFNSMAEIERLIALLSE